MSGRVETAAKFAPRFDDKGLLPAIVVDAGDGAVLMLAYMNAEALSLTRETGEAHFWSRSRAAMWRKGATSGQVLAVKRMRVDCDQDTVVLEVVVGGDGTACHTGARSCFFREVAADGKLKPV